MVTPQWRQRVNGCDNQSPHHLCDKLCNHACVCVWMICSVYYFPWRVAFQWDIPSHWWECWSANGDEMNARAIHNHMGSLPHMPEDGKWETVRSWRWTAQCRLNSGGDIGSLLELSPFKTIADLYCILQCNDGGKDRFGSAPSPKSRWCKRTRVLSKWSPADCWPLCLFPSIMPSSVCVCVGGEGCLFACQLVHLDVRVQVRDFEGSVFVVVLREWAICPAHIQPSISSPGPSPACGDRKAVAV